MNRLLLIVVAVLLIGGLFVSGCSPAAAPSTSAPASSTPAPAAKTITLKFAYDPPPTGAAVAGWNWWADQVQTQSNGRIKIDFYPGGALYAQAAALDSLKAGIADITNVSLMDNSPSFPVTNVMALPTLNFPDTTPQGYKDSYSAFTQLLAKYPAISDEYKDVHILFWDTMPAYRIVSKKQVTVPNDLKGMKVGGGGSELDQISLAGGAPVQINPPNSYESLDKGVIEGVFVAWFHVGLYKLPEITSYALEYAGTGQNVTQILMNLKTWNSLPPDIQKIMTDLAPESMSRSANGYLTQNQAGIQAFQAKNRTIITPNADQLKLWDALGSPIQDKWLKNMQAKGISSAQDILNTLTSIRSQTVK